MLVESTSLLSEMLVWNVSKQDPKIDSNDLFIKGKLVIHFLANETRSSCVDQFYDYS